MFFLKTTYLKREGDRWGKEEQMMRKKQTENREGSDVKVGPLDDTGLLIWKRQI